MERFHQVVSGEGLQIPLPIMEKFGLQPGAPVVLELDDQGIRIVPARPGQTEIEGLALRYLLTSLGDAVTVRAERKDEDWQVSVYSLDQPEVLGHLTFSSKGEFLSDQSTTPDDMRQKAIAAYTSK